MRAKLDAVYIRSAAMTVFERALRVLVFGFLLLGLSSCGGDVGIGFAWHHEDGHPWPDHPDWPGWPDRPQGATGLFPIAGDVCGQCAGSQDGTGGAARFNGPQGIAADAAGNLYVAESPSATVRKISPQGVVTTLAGTRGAVGYADGPGAAARFSDPGRLVADSNGNLYVTDSGNHTLRRIDTNGGNDLYIADTGNSTIRRINLDNVTSTVAGVPGHAGITLGALPGSLDRPIGVTLAPDRSIALTTHNLVVKLLPAK
jgi:hypothetical protein